MTLDLPITEATTRKLRALAMLSGQNVDTIKDDLANLLDRMISERCAELLGADVEVSEHIPQEVTEPQVVQPATPLRVAKPKAGSTKKPKAPPKKSFADAHKEASGGPAEVQEAFSSLEVEDPVSGHALSADEDDGDGRSLQEQYEQEAAGTEDEEEVLLRQTLKQRKVKDVGGNAEAFLDVSMGNPEDRDTDEIPNATRGYGGIGMYSTRPRVATKSFESRLRNGHKARVTAHTGDEEDAL